MSIESGNSQETPESVEIEQAGYEDEFCPYCGAPLYFSEEWVIENDMLYIASGGYDGRSVSREWKCPGCEYTD